jgi:hypothetical protein
MKFAANWLLLALTVLLLSSTLCAQEKNKQEIEIHKNITLVEMPPAQDIPADLVKNYQAFLPMFLESLKEITVDQTDECSLTVRVNAGFKVVGSSKVNRATADITAFRKNAKVEYSGRLILYSYVTSGPISKEETIHFLKKQILEPAECHKE